MILKLLTIIVLMFSFSNGLYAAAVSLPARAMGADSNVVFKVMSRREMKKKAESDSRIRDIRKSKGNWQRAFSLGIISLLVSALGAVGMLVASQGTFFFGLSVGVAGLGVLGLVIAFFMMLMLLGFLF